MFCKIIFVCFLRFYFSFYSIRWVNFWRGIKQGDLILQSRRFVIKRIMRIACVCAKVYLRTAFHVELFIWQRARSSPTRNLQIRVSRPDGNFWTIIKMSGQTTPYHLLNNSCNYNERTPSAFWTLNCETNAWNMCTRSDFYHICYFIIKERKSRKISNKFKK